MKGPMKKLASILALIFAIATAIKSWTFFVDPQIQDLYSGIIFLLFALFFLIARIISHRSLHQKF